MEKKSDIIFDFWACQRPLTRHWGSGQVFTRLESQPWFGKIDAAFGKTDNIPDGVRFFDLTNGDDWKKMSLADSEIKKGFWDPPYDKMYKQEGKEIWRCCQELAILHTFIWPHKWLDDVAKAKRVAMVAVTMGPLKQIRCLQVFQKL